MDTKNGSNPELNWIQAVFQVSICRTTQVQARWGFAEKLRQTKTLRNPKNIIKTAAPRRRLQRLVRILKRIAYNNLALTMGFPTIFDSMNLNIISILQVLDLHA